jgi:hypothetical protein
MRKLLTWSLLIAAVLFLWHRCSPIQHAPGVLARDEPSQKLFISTQPVIKKKGWSLQPLAIFTIEARVLGIELYSGDPSGDLSPYDLALGWGKMSDTAVLEKLDISQSGRFYHWRYWGEKPPITESEITTQSANIHIIPEDDIILGRIKSLRKGALVRMSGYLVEATHPQGSEPWRSSLSREDTGKGACEIFYVRTVTVK